MEENKKLQPIVKWVGGKRSLLDKILPIIRETYYETYFEPFLGGGAIFLALAPQKAIVNDYNDELMNVYHQVKYSIDKLLPLLANHEQLNSEAYFYDLRAMDRKSDYSLVPKVIRAARFLYLNKTSYNGLYRVNKNNQCNMPYGRYAHPNIVNEDGLRALSAYLNNNKVILYSYDYSSVLCMASFRDLVYLDPPYMPVSKSASFTAYNSQGFAYAEQVRLKKECDKLRERNVSFIESNADTPEIRELYKDYSLIELTARRSVNSRGDLRSGAKEVLIVSGRAEETARKLGLI